MVAQAPNLVLGLQFHLVEELAVARIGRTGEHEVLPDQDTGFVAHAVEDVPLVDAAAPHAEAVHAGRYGVRKEPPVVLSGRPGGKHRNRNPVGPSAEDRVPVDQRHEGFTLLILPAQNFGAAHGEAGRRFRGERERGIVLAGEGEADHMEGALAHGQGPPKPRVAHAEAEAAGGAARTQFDCLLRLGQHGSRLVDDLRIKAAAAAPLRDDVHVADDHGMLGGGITQGHGGHLAHIREGRVQCHRVQAFQHGCRMDPRTGKAGCPVPPRPALAAAGMDPRSVEARGQHTVDTLQGRVDLGCRAEVDDEFVGSIPEILVHLETVFSEVVLGDADPDPVQIDRAPAVHVVQDEGDTCSRRVERGVHVELDAEDPVDLLDPTAVAVVESNHRIRNPPDRVEEGQDVGGPGRVQPGPVCGIRETQWHPERDVLMSADAPPCVAEILLRGHVEVTVSGNFGKFNNKNALVVAF